MINVTKYAASIVARTLVTAASRLVSTLAFDQTLRVSILFPAFLSIQPMLPAQNPPPKVDARQMYAKLCAGCHGADAHGSQQGPGLAGNSGVRRRSVQNLRNVILRGIPAAGMPPFQLPDATLDALVALVKSLNSPAADSKVPGDREAGKEFFLDKGQC